MTGNQKGGSNVGTQGRRIHGSGRTGAYTMPAGLDLPGSPPFWVAVAYWGWQQGRPVSAKEVETVFEVKRYAASNVLSYLLLAYGQTLCITRHDVPAPGARARRFVLIGAPPPLPAIARERVQVRAANTVQGLSEKVASVLRSWGRRPGKDMPDV